MQGVSRGLPVRVVDEYKIWDRLRVESSLPLYQLSWKDYSSDGSYVSRVSQSVWLDFIVNSGTVDSSNGVVSYFHSLPTDWFKNPYLYIYVISVADLDSYREKQKMRLHVFAEACREKKVEYLIVYSPPSTAPLAAALATTNSNVSSLSLRMFTEEDPAQRARRKVFERLKTELNVIKGRETVVKLDQGGTVPAFFIHRLRESIVAAIEQRVKGYRKEIEKYLQNRSVPGWSLQKFVALNESLSFVYYQAGHLESSLKCYQTTLDFLLTNKMSVFRQASTKISVARQVLYYGCEENRHSLCQNLLGELEVFSYIFSRQFALLYSLRMFEEIPTLVFNYLVNIYQRTKLMNDNSEIFFLQAWIFCCCSLLRDSPYVPGSSIGDETEEHVDEQHTFPFYFPTDFVAKLIFIQLLCFSNFLHSKFDKISAQVPCVYLDVEKIFADSRQSVTVDERILKEDEALSHDLESVENGCTKFIELYRTLEDLLDKTGRQRLVSEIRGYYGVTLATVGRLEEARQVLENELTLLSNEQWSLVVLYHLRWLAKTERDLERSKEYLLCCLNVLQHLCELQRNYTENVFQSLKHEAPFWVEQVNELCKTIPDTLSYPMDKIFRLCRIVTSIQSEEIFQFDPLSLDISLESELAAGLSVEKCTVVFAEQSNIRDETERKKLYLESNGPFVVLPGSNIIIVSTDSLEHCGMLFVESIRLQMHRLELIWEATDPLDSFFPSSTGLTISERPPLGRVFLGSYSECYTHNGRFYIDQDVEVEASQHSSVEGARVSFGFSKQDQISLQLPTIEADDHYRFTVSIPIPAENFNFSKIVSRTRETYSQDMTLFATLTGKEILSSGEEKEFRYKTEKDVALVFPFSVQVDCKTLLLDDQTVKFVLSCSCCRCLVSRFMNLRIPSVTVSVPELELNDGKNGEDSLNCFYFEKPFQKRFFFFKLSSKVDMLKKMFHSREESFFRVSCCISKFKDALDENDNIMLKCPFSFVSLLPSYIFKVEYQYDSSVPVVQGAEFTLRIHVKIVRWEGDNRFGEGFEYAVDNESFGWIVMGKFRGFFSRDESCMEIEVELVPIFTGVLYLPSINLYHNGEAVQPKNIFQVDYNRQVTVKSPRYLISPSIP